MLAGVNVFRLNFSHGSHEVHAASVANITRLNAEMDLNVAILADLSGPKIRTGMVEGDSLLLKPGDFFIITTRDEATKGNTISVNYKDFAADVKAGEDILLDDGKLLLRATASNGTDEVTAKVVQGGLLFSRKGVNLPKTKLGLPGLSEKDLNDLELIVTLNIQWVALSFVRTANDIRELRKKLQELSSSDPPRIVAKIEKPEAVDNAGEIISVSDAIMVARGDLGVEIPQEQVPVIQKKLVRMCVAASKPVIVATQMMEGMISNMRPTRAEVNDVANSVLDGADALMLSGETAVGNFPVQTVETMNRIISDVEVSDIFYPDIKPDEGPRERRISDSVILAACNLAREVNARALIAMTYTGYSAFRLAGHRTGAGIYIFSNNRNLLCALNLVWGVTGIYSEKFSNTDTAMLEMRQTLITRGYITTGNYIIYVSSIPIGKPGKTNMLKLSIV